MAKVFVGGTNGLIDRLLTLMGWPASANTADPQRKDALNALNLNEKMISQADGLSYRRIYTTVTLPNNTKKIPVPNDMDLGMDFTMEHPSGHGKISIVPPDKFAAVPITIPFDRIDNAPVHFMFAIDPLDNALKFFSRRSVATGDIIYPISYQQIVVNLIDDVAGAGSVSLLPEGYELTLLLPIAEEYLKSRKTYPDVATLSPSNQAAIASFYNKYRTNKEEPTTDTNKAARKAEVDQLQTIGR